jgi:hypothetical protein
VVDYQEIFTLPRDYLADGAAELGSRCVSRPLFLEQFSQAFARFFMRVGLPATIPEFG